jgi:tight adherence protein B
MSSSIGLGCVVAVLAGGMSRSLVIGAVFGLIAGRAPFALVSYRAALRQAQMRDVWPEVVDNLASGIRAGLSLPEAVAQIGDRGPESVRPAFAGFASDFRVSGRFTESLDELKARLADPVADRIIEALRITREVGGTDVGRLLRTLAEFLREDARTRGELEARQSWTVNAARLAVAAPWLVLAMLATRGANAQAFNSAAGVTVLVAGGAATVLAYRLMVRLGRLPEEARVLR